MSKDWQPIETAPKDTDIIAGHDHEKWVLPVYWHNGWQADGGPVHPTHWMPFPSPPQPKAETENYQGDSRYVK
jgi:hypothetical protein